MRLRYEAYLRFAKLHFPREPRTAVPANFQEAVSDHLSMRTGYSQWTRSRPGVAAKGGPC
jgi:hypothetical protein